MPRNSLVNYLWTSWEVRGGGCGGPWRHQKLGHGCGCGVTFHGSTSHSNQARPPGGLLDPRSVPPDLDKFQAKSGTFPWFTKLSIATLRPLATSLPEVGPGVVPRHMEHVSASDRASNCAASFCRCSRRWFSAVSCRTSSRSCCTACWCTAAPDTVPGRPTAAVVVAVAPVAVATWAVGEGGEANGHARRPAAMANRIEDSRETFPADDRWASKKGGKQVMRKERRREP